MSTIINIVTDYNALFIAMNPAQVDPCTFMHLSLSQTVAATQVIAQLAV